MKQRKLKRLPERGEWPAEVGWGGVGARVHWVQHHETNGIAESRFVTGREEGTTKNCSTLPLALQTKKERRW